MKVTTKVQIHKTRSDEHEVVAKVWNAEPPDESHGIKISCKWLLRTSQARDLVRGNNIPRTKLLNAFFELFDLAFRIALLSNRDHGQICGNLPFSGPDELCLSPSRPLLTLQKSNKHTHSLRNHVSTLSIPLQRVLAISGRRFKVGIACQSSKSVPSSFSQGFEGRQILTLPPSSSSTRRQVTSYTPAWHGVGSPPDHPANDLP